MSASPEGSSVRVLVVRKDDGLRPVAMLVRALGVDADEVTSVGDALRVLPSRAYDLVLFDLPFWAAEQRPGPGHELLAARAASGSRTPFVAVVSNESTETRDLLMHGGATDCISRAVLTEHHVFGLLVRFTCRLADDGVKLVGRSPEIRRVRELTARAAHGKLELPVLVTGETGTGKELVAQAIHALGPRREAPIVAVNCGALPPALLEAELFGHERGAFTGADRERPGLFERAAGGTVFLDEIGELPRQGQASLLRVLETRRTRRIGGVAEVPVDFRLVAATNRDLRRRIDKGRFREDLYQRIAGIEIAIPPLRERREDIPLLVDAILSAARAARFTDEAVAALGAHDWSEGNVRELKMFVLRMLELCDERVIDAPMVEAALGGADPKRRLAEVARLVLALGLDEPPEYACKDALYGAAVELAGTHTGAAALLQRDRRAVDRWVEEQRLKKKPRGNGT